MTPEQLQAYLLWQKERGFKYPAFSAPSQKQVPLVRGAGSMTASHVCFLHCPQDSDKIIEGEERNALIKILQTLQIDVRNDVYLLGLVVGANDSLLATKEDYETELRERLTKLQPKMHFAFGAVAIQMAGDLCPLVPLWHPRELLLL